jgi:hypothetical protein
MKNLIKSAALLLCAIIFISCNNDDDIITDPGGGTTTANLSGNIQNWPGQILIAQAIATGTGAAVVGTDTIIADGNLNMNLTTPPPAILRSVDDIFNDSAVTISDTTAFYAAFGNLTVFDISNTMVGRIERKNFDTTAVTGSFIVSFIYVDRDCNITGTVVSASGTDTTSTELNLTLEQGWNVFYTQQTGETSTTTSLLIASGEPAGANWRYTASPVANRLHRLFKF